MKKNILTLMDNEMVDYLMNNPLENKSKVFKFLLEKESNETFDLLSKLKEKEMIEMYHYFLSDCLLNKVRVSKKSISFFEIKVFEEFKKHISTKSFLVNHYDNMIKVNKDKYERLISSVITKSNYEKEKLFVDLIAIDIDYSIDLLNKLPEKDIFPIFKKYIEVLYKSSGKMLLEESKLLNHFSTKIQLKSMVEYIQTSFSSTDFKKKRYYKDILINLKDSHLFEVELKNLINDKNINIFGNSVVSYKNNQYLDDFKKIVEYIKNKPEDNDLGVILKTAYDNKNIFAVDYMLSFFDKFPDLLMFIELQRILSIIDLNINKDNKMLSVIKKHKNDDDFCIDYITNLGNKTKSFVSKNYSALLEYIFDENIVSNKKISESSLDKLINFEVLSLLSDKLPIEQSRINFLMKLHEYKDNKLFFNNLLSNIYEKDIYPEKNVSTLIYIFLNDEIKDKPKQPKIKI